MDFRASAFVLPTHVMFTASPVAYHRRPINNCERHLVWADGSQCQNKKHCISTRVQAWRKEIFIASRDTTKFMSQFIKQVRIANVLCRRTNRVPFDSHHKQRNKFMKSRSIGFPLGNKLLVRWRRRRSSSSTLHYTASWTSDGHMFVRLLLLCHRIAVVPMSMYHTHTFLLFN